LVAYNGTADGPTPASYVPQIATCVPGSGECAAQFGGNDLVWDNNTTGAPQYYTFEIDSGARFYDQGTGIGWSVYPSDVLFSYARTMAWADLPYEEATNGWINTQDLVPAGNFGWDSGIHAPLNNTPQHILNAFLVNNSYYCPNSPVVTTNGCITFNVGASGLAWPYFLELVADNLGGSIEPCGMYTFLGGGVPGFNGTYANGNGDGPCWLPGNSTSTQQPGFIDYISTTPAKGWDAFEEEALNLPAIQPGVQWTDVGSGPYWVENPISPSVGYNLHTNPDYNAPVGCVGQPGCEPIKGTYAANVQVVWEASGDSQGLNEMTTGQADSAGFFPGDTSVVLGLNDYKLITGVPALTVFFDPIVLNFSLAAYSWLDTDPINVPGTFFENVALRNFLVNSYPYTVVNQYDTVDGIQFGEDYGGAIPHGMGDYYPANVTWPTGNPVNDSTTPGNVGWWWAQANNVSSPEYDPQLANCTVAIPCTWDMFGSVGNTVLDGDYDLWNAEIFNLSGGHLNPGINDVSQCLGVCCISTCPPGQNGAPIYSFGWVADYPDPSDIMAPLYYPDNSYTYPDAVSETLQAAPNNASTCPHDYGAWSNLTHWANLGQLPTRCQGAAYDTMVAWMEAASHQPNITYQTLEYNLIEHIANELALYMYNPQGLTVIDYANWIQGSTINENPTLGGEGVQLWYDWQYASNYFSVNFSELGLPAGTTWSVTVAGVSLNATAPNAISFPQMVNGTYPYIISAVSGYLLNYTRGNFVINGAAFSLMVTFSVIKGPQYTVSFQETGLEAGTEWYVVVVGPAGGATPRGTTATLNASLGVGNYTYTPGGVTGFALPTPGYVNVTKNTTVTVAYTSLVYPPFPQVSFTESGLPSGTTWEVTVNGTFLKGATPSLSTVLGNGTYSWGVVSPTTGWNWSPSAGTFPVSGAAVNVAITATPLVTTSSPSPAWTYLSALAWTLIAAVAVLALLLGFLAGWRSGGRPPPNPPPRAGDAPPPS